MLLTSLCSEDHSCAPFSEYALRAKNIAENAGCSFIVQSAKNIIKQSELGTRVDSSGKGDALFLATTKGKPLAANNSHVAFRETFKILFQVACFDNLIIEIFIELAKADNVDTDCFVL